MMVFISKDGSAQPRPVEILIDRPDLLLLGGDVQPGDMVIVVGNENVQPGRAVNPISARPSVQLKDAAPLPPETPPAAAPEQAEETGAEQ